MAAEDPSISWPNHGLFASLGINWGQHSANATSTVKIASDLTTSREQTGRSSQGHPATDSFEIGLSFWMCFQCWYYWYSSIWIKVILAAVSFNHKNAAMLSVPSASSATCQDEQACAVCLHSTGGRPATLTRGQSTVSKKIAMSRPWIDIPLSCNKKLQHTSTSRFQLATLNCAAGSREINTQKINLKLPAPLRFQQRYSRTTAYNVALKVFSRLNAMLACISLNFTLTSLGTQHRLSRRKRAKKMKVLHWIHRLRRLRL